MVTVKGILTEADREKLRDAVRDAEARTAGEIVVMVIPESDPYPLAGVIGAALASLPAAAALTPLAGGFFWMGEQNMWVFLTLFIGFFAGLHPLFMAAPVLKRLCISNREMAESIEKAAMTRFYRENLHATREATGVLVLVSVFERRVQILADRGINDRVPPDTWNRLVADIVSGIKSGEAAAALCRAVDGIADILERHFPCPPDDRDELENLIIEP
jgi:putative membrane protein